MEIAELINECDARLYLVLFDSVRTLSEFIE